MKIKSTVRSIAAAVSITCAAVVFAEDTPTDDNGNRYNRDRQYDSEISAADAYQRMMQNKGVVVDVRRLREFAAGHPERAYNIPYPHIVNSNDQTAYDFYMAVHDLVKGDTNREIYTLCRTGSRSIDAANILADPENLAGDPRRVGKEVYGVPAFKNVHNIWEGFVGRELFAFTSAGVPDPTVKLDLNNDGFINEDKADVYAHTTDMNPDKDGWRNFPNLPWETHIRKPQAYMKNLVQYECWQTDEGCE
jgi:rhodanese-related sulfurtransferase